MLFTGGCFSRPEFVAGDGGGSDDSSTGPIKCPDLNVAPGIVAYLPFDTVTNMTTPEASIYHNDGMLNGGLALTAGRIGMGLRWSAQGQAVSLGSPDSLDQLPALTVCTWIQPQIHTDAVTLVDKSFNGAGGGWNFYMIPDAGMYGLGFVNRSRVNEESLKVIPTDGTWTHVCVTWDGQDSQRVGNKLEGIHFYAEATGIDVVTVNETAHRTPENDAINPVRIGNVTGSTDYTFRGVMDEVTIFNRELSQSEIAALRDCAP